MSKLSDFARKLERENGLDDKTLLALPHPKRIAIMGEATGSINLFQQAMYRSNPSFATEIANRNRQMGSLLGGARKTFGGLGMNGLDGCTNNGELMTLLTTLMYLYRGGRILTVTDALDARLRETDMGNEAPCSALRAPYPAVFMEFGTARDTPYRVHNVASGEHVFEGAYIFESREVTPTEPDEFLDFIGVKPGTPCRVIDLALAGSPVGKQGLFDDAIMFFEIFIPEEQEDTELKVLVDKHLDAFDTVLPRTRGYLPFTPRENDAIRQCILHIVKSLLYLQCSNRVINEEREESDLRDRLESTGARKQAKLARRMMRVYDRVLVGPVRFQDGQTGKHRAGVAMHWRRGHIRRQRFGAGLTETRLAWIEPVLVNANETAPEPKDYKVV